MKHRPQDIQFVEQLRYGGTPKSRIFGRIPLAAWGKRHEKRGRARLTVTKLCCLRVEDDRIVQARQVIYSAFLEKSKAV